MVFSSIPFLCVFLPAVLILCCVLPSIRWKNGLLIVASLLFYAYGEPVYVILMIISTLANYGFGLLLGRGAEEFRAAEASLRESATDLSPKEFAQRRKNEIRRQNAAHRDPVLTNDLVETIRIERLHRVRRHLIERPRRFLVRVMVHIARNNERRATFAGVLAV